MDKKFNLLFPGRHHLVTKFQVQYLNNVLSQKDIADLLDFNGEKLWLQGRVGQIIFAITSANHKNTKRNPLSGERRWAMLERVGVVSNIDPLVYYIDDIGANPRFADYVVKKISMDAGDLLDIRPDNTVVATSTDTVARMYMRLWYKVLPVERDPKLKTFSQPTPWNALDAMEKSVNAWEDPFLDTKNNTLLHPECLSFLDKYRLWQDIRRIFSDHITNRNGALTDTRDFNIYGRSFDDSWKRKYEQIKDDILAWNIADFGCCRGSILRELSHDDLFRESDLHGVDIVPLFISACENLKEEWVFANDNTFFHCRNAFSDKVFSDNSLNTIISLSTTHEIYSYESEDSLKRFVKLVYDQLTIWWRWINVDVIGPSEPEKIVKVKLAADDGCGREESRFTELFERTKSDYEANRSEWTAYVHWLSTYARFKLFTKTFRYKQGDRSCDYEDNGKDEITIKSRDIAEFMSKKDYIDNRLSEMNEYFCFYSFEDRKQVVQESWLEVNPKSELLYNDRVYQNRYEDKVMLFDIVTNEQLPYFPTNMKLLCDKKLL